jgi:dimeric dUTPase (all-alpha-NTP-PPase superfamily)
MDERLHGMFKKQIELQVKLGNNDLVGNQKFITEMTLAAVDELMEALRETPWKSWKKNQELNKEAFKEELIDVWHFLINLSLAAGMTSEEVYVRFLCKNKINENRKKEGY